MAQLAIDAAEKGDFTVAEELYNLLKLPYEEQPEFEANWFQKRPGWAKHRVGCSMLSCSSLWLNRGDFLLHNLPHF